MSTTNRREVPPEGNTPDFAADATAFGEYLRTRRQNAGVSLDQITNETKIPQRHFDALEHGSVRSWPRGMYTRAMLRAYAESVGLDKEHVANEFERVFPPHNPPPVAAPVAVAPPTVAAPRVRRRTASFAAGLAIAVAVVIFVAVFAFRSGDAPLAVADQTAVPLRTTDIVLHSAAAPVSAVTAAPIDRAPASAAAVDGELVIRSDPPGARVMVDGVGRGSTPAHIRYLPLGTKRVRLTKDGYVSAERSINLNPKAPSVTMQLTLAPRH